jgi:hypothetical protein
MTEQFDFVALYIRGGVVNFDTTYRTNHYNMSLAMLCGVQQPATNCGVCTCFDKG